MGICGLGLCWRVAAQVLSAPHAIGEGLIALATALFVVLGTMYLLKVFNAPDAVAAEFRNPATSSQFGCLTIALLLPWALDLRTHGGGQFHAVVADSYRWQCHGGLCGFQKFLGFCSRSAWGFG